MSRCAERFITHTLNITYRYCHIRHFRYADSRSRLSLRRHAARFRYAAYVTIMFDVEADDDATPLFH